MCVRSPGMNGNDPEAPWEVMNGTRREKDSLKNM